MIESDSSSIFFLNLIYYSYLLLFSYYSNVEHPYYFRVFYLQNKHNDMVYKL